MKCLFFFVCLQEAKKIAEEQSLVNAANTIDNPLNLLAPMFKKYERNG